MHAGAADRRRVLLLVAALDPVLRPLLGSGRAVGLTVTIFNPRLDPDGAIARLFVDVLVAGVS